MQKLEFGNGAKTATLSFYVTFFKTGTYSVGTKKRLVRLGPLYLSTQFSSANTWEYKTITIPGVTDGSWPIDNTRGLTH